MQLEQLFRTKEEDKAKEKREGCPGSEKHSLQAWEAAKWRKREAGTQGGRKPEEWLVLNLQNIIMQHLQLLSTFMLGAVLFTLSHFQVL